MKTIGALGVVMIATLSLLEPAQAGSRGGGSRGGGRSFSAARTFSGSGGHFARSGNFSRGGGARYSGSSARFAGRGSGGRYYTPATRLSSGATFRHRGGSGNRNRAFNPGAFSTSGSRLAGSGDRTFNNGNFSRSGGRFAGNRTTGRNFQGLSDGERIVGRRSGNWNRNWDRKRDHYWRGHRCRWINNSWVIFATGFYPYGYGYPYGWGYGAYPYGSYYDSGYYDSGYYDDSYAAGGYSQEPDGSGSEGRSADSEISRVQAALARQGYYHGAIDGDAGPATRNALRRYQREHGLDVNGQIDQQVLDALGIR